jgi:hypothetical protein
MIQTPIRKQFYPLMAALLALSVFGLLIFSSAEMPNTLEIEGRMPYSKSAFTPFDYTVYWLAEETSITNRAKKNSSSAAWNGTLRVLMPVEILSVAVSLITLLTSLIYLHNINNAVPLKLRI